MFPGEPDAPAIRGDVRDGLGGRGGAVPVGPLAPASDGADVALLERCRRAAEVRHRRRIQQPWSLLLQLLGIALLLLALGAVARWGRRRAHPAITCCARYFGVDGRAREGEDADGSGARACTGVRRVAAFGRSRDAGPRRRAVDTCDRVRDNRDVLEQAIDASQPGATALNLEQAFDFARQAQKLQGGRPGEIVYVGSGRVAQAPSTRQPTAALSEFCRWKRLSRTAGCGRSACAGAQRIPTFGIFRLRSRTIPRSRGGAMLALAFAGSPVGARDDGAGERAGDGDVPVPDPRGRVAGGAARPGGRFRPEPPRGDRSARASCVEGAGLHG